MQLDKTRAALRRKLERLELQNAARKEEQSNRAKPTLPPALETGHPSCSSRHRASNATAPRSRRKRAQLVILDQWVEIESNKDGRTITTLYPTNEALLDSSRELSPPPELVYRRLHFVNGVPDEYLWSTSEATIRSAGGMGIQRMGIDTWLALIRREASEGNGHLLPIGNLPRPEKRGGCECEVCTVNQQIIPKRT